MVNVKKRAAVKCGAIMVFALSATSAKAAEECNALLAHGIYDYARSEKIDNSASYLQNEICTTYSKYKSDQAGGNAKASYGLFGGKASYSQQQIESIGSAMCAGSISDASASALLNAASSKISPVAVQAWADCNKQSKEFRVNTEFANDNSAVAIKVLYTLPPGSTVYPRFAGINMSPSGAFDCSGALAKLPINTPLTSAELQMLCNRRKPPAGAVDTTGNPVIYPAASLQVATTAGSITRHLAPVYKPEDPIPAQLGDVVASLLDPAKFAVAHGKGWVLADGRPVPNTKYASQVGTSVPDLRGVFLRGKNNGRSVNEGNADGDLNLGSWQAQAFIKHSHSTVQMIGDNNIDGVDSTTTQSGDHHNEARDTGEKGGNETRPNNVTVNYFIKVD